MLKNENSIGKMMAETACRPEPGFLKQYRRCYPRAKKFHVTSDGLVFPDDKKPQMLTKGASDVAS